MKPYKILRPTLPIWNDTKVEVSITEKKIIKLPLKLITNCHPIPKSRHIAEKVRITAI